MVEIKLTNNEWYVIYYQILKLQKEFPDNKYLNSIIRKLIEKSPTSDNIYNKEVFKKEYECRWAK